MSEDQFSFHQFLEDSKNTLINPKKYFSSMSEVHSMGNSIIKALIYGLIAGIINFIWSELNLTIISFILSIIFKGSSAVGIMAGITTLITSIMLSVFILITGSIILLLLSAVCGGISKFETIVSVTASLMVLIPLHAILNVTFWFDIFLGFVISLIIGLYGIRMLYYALVNTFKANEGIVRAITIILAIIPTLIFISYFIFVSGENFGAKYNERKFKGVDKKIHQHQRMAPRGQIGI